MAISYIGNVPLYYTASLPVQYLREVDVATSASYALLADETVNANISTSSIYITGSVTISSGSLNLNGNPYLISEVNNYQYVSNYILYNVNSNPTELFIDGTGSRMYSNILNPVSGTITATANLAFRTMYSTASAIETSSYIGGTYTNIFTKNAGSNWVTSSNMAGNITGSSYGNSKIIFGISFTGTYFSASFTITTGSGELYYVSYGLANVNIMENYK